MADNHQFLVFPLHDTTGHLMNLLLTDRPFYKEHFAGAFVSITPATAQALKDQLDFLIKDPFFSINFNKPDSRIGDHHLTAYRNAINLSPSDALLHLCTLDRLSYIVNNHAGDFVRSLSQIKTVPLQFIRSPAAWATHPACYREAENLPTELGKLIFNKIVDFCWCHLVVPRDRLKSVLPDKTPPGLGIYAQIVLPLVNELAVVPVDWLAWEDPYIFDKNPDELKKSKDRDPAELAKRLDYVIPILNLVSSAYKSPDNAKISP